MKVFLSTITLLASLFFPLQAQSAVVAYNLSSGIHGRNEIYSFSFNNLAPHDEITINFDLTMWDSWDGNHWYWGTDTFGMRVDGNTIFEYSFSNFTNSAWEGSNPYSPTRYGRIGRTLWWQDSIYEDYAGGFSLDHTASDLNIEFYSTGLQSLWDESWEVDNLRVTSADIAYNNVPEPSMNALLLISLISMGVISRKNRKKLR